MAHILAVDDSKSLRQMVTFTLKGAGHQVEEAEDGVEALEMASRATYDLVLTDVNMPRMDGLQLIQKLRQLPGYKLTPLITLTTEMSDTKKKQGKEAGATGWIVKPFDPDKLLEVIKRFRL